MKWRILILSAISLFFTACQVQENIQDGQTAYKLKKYKLAAELLQKISTRLNCRMKNQKYFKLAKSYANNNNYENAGEWYVKAYD
ncbi:MAG: hypothetical protein IPQ11_16685 [Bacteroidetes bacterium]|nr:hypothetical protein [Bacteroidota bacterium]